MSSTYIIAGIDTDAGKTLASAILCRGLIASYWKPIQAGTEPMTDTQQVRSWTGLDSKRFLPETYLLQAPMSPHAAAAKENIRIDDAGLDLPEIDENLIVESAGGLMVPINEQVMFIDLMERWQTPVILVSRTYLGSINHTLLSIEALNQRNIPIAGIIFNEGGRPESEQAILDRSDVKMIGRIPLMESINPDTLDAVWKDFDQKLIV